MNIYTIKNFIRFVICICVISMQHICGMDLCAYNVEQANFNTINVGNNYLIFDCGIDHYNANYYIDSMKDNSILNIFISHPHKDHYSGLETWLYNDNARNHLKNCKIYLCGNSNDWNRTNALQAFVGACMNCEYLYPLYPQSLLSDANLQQMGIGITVFGYPNYWHDNRPNSVSPLIKVQFQGKSILFTGDADYKIPFYKQNVENFEIQEWETSFYSNPPADEKNDDPEQAATLSENYYQNFLKSNYLLNKALYSDIVVLPHHGSCSHFSYMFHKLACCPFHPVISIICSNPEKKNHLPKYHILKELRDYSKGNGVYANCGNKNSEVFLTSESGVVPFFHFGIYNSQIFQTIYQYYKAKLFYFPYPLISGSGAGDHIKDMLIGWQKINAFNIKKVFEKMIYIDIASAFKKKQHINRILRIQEDNVEDGYTQNTQHQLNLNLYKQFRSQIPIILKNAGMSVKLLLTGNNFLKHAFGECVYQKDPNNPKRFISATTGKSVYTSQDITRKLKANGLFDKTSAIKIAVDASDSLTDYKWNTISIVK